MTDNERIEAQGNMVATLIGTLVLSAIVASILAIMSYEYGYWRGVAVGAKVVPAVEAGK